MWTTHPGRVAASAAAMWLVTLLTTDGNGVGGPVAGAGESQAEPVVSELLRIVEGDAGALSGTVTQCRLGGWHLERAAAATA